MGLDQNNGINKKTSPPKDDPGREKYLSSLPHFLITLHEGEGIPMKVNINMEEKPSWLDEDLFQRGQAFAARNEVSMMITEIISLFMTYTIKMGIQPIVYSGHAIYLFEGYKRYMITHKHFLDFYKGEPWCRGSPSYHSLKIVREIHEKYRQKMINEDPETIKRLITISGKGISKPYRGFHKEALVDFKQACPFEYKIEPIIKENELVFFSQMVMSVGQFGFVSLPILRPEFYGSHNETDKDLEGFVHLWRVIGYYLGIEDKYNFCQGSLEEVRQRIKDVITYWVKPGLATIDEEWAHMTHIVVDGIGLSWKIYYSTMLLLFCDTIGIPANHIRQALSFLEWLQYKVITLGLYWAFRISFIKEIISSWLSKRVKRELEFSPHFMKYIHDRANKFEQNNH